MLGRSEILIRLLLSALVGGLIGIEREMNNRPAGLRTHILVTLGSTLLMLISIDGFFLAEEGSRLGDPARIAAQVVSGIGFLGAGTIMKTGNNIVGLTTAASLWVSAGIGLAIGAGYYFGGIVTASIVLLTLMSLGVMEKRNLRKKYRTVEVVGVNKPGFIGKVGSLFAKYDVSIKDVKVLDNDDEDMMKVEFLLKIPMNFDRQSFDFDVYETPEIIGVYFGKNGK